MISVAVKGYGIVIWDDADGLRTFGVSDALSAVLADRVDTVLQTVRVRSEEQICEALMSLSGAHLLAQSCDHGPGGCGHDIDLN